MAESQCETLPIRQYPTEFRCWLLYKNLVNIVLLNDGFAYAMLAYKCFNLPTMTDLSSPLVYAQYLLAILLAFFHKWAKSDAHRVVGDYAWFWGDFFFRKSSTLIFDGVFELFPHPMYTVGYSALYGACLLTRSYMLFFVSLAAHSMQMAFLFLVEEPHIQRVYGGASQKSDASGESVPHISQSIVYFGLDSRYAGDVALVLLSVYAVGLTVLVSDPTYLVGQVVLWRAIHFFGIGYILWCQSVSADFTNSFLQRGFSLFEAFCEWKHIYNMSLTMNILVFVCCSLRYLFANVSESDIFSSPCQARLSIGVVLILLSVYSHYSAYTSTGGFAWYWGDFFIPPTIYSPSLCHTGIYRFLKHPDAITGVLGFYGLSLISGSWLVFSLAVLAHVSSCFFLFLEIPHMQKLYPAHDPRISSSLWKKINEIYCSVGCRGKAKEI